MKQMQRIWFMLAVALGWLSVVVGITKIVMPNDATTTESMVPHFVGWLLLMSVGSIASCVPEWRFTGRTWQKFVFWLAPTVVILDVFLHWALFGIRAKTVGELSAPERGLLTLIYFVIGPLVLATLLALLTQLGKRRSVVQS